MENPATLIVPTLAGIFAAFFLITNIVKAGVARSKLNAIPTIGPSGILTSYIGAYHFFLNARDMVQEGYDKHYGTAFKVPTMPHWTVVASGPKMVEDFRRATADQLSLREVVNEVIQADYTIGPEIQRDPYHVSTVRTPLTRNLGVRFSDIQDEIATSFTDLVPPTNDWIKVPAHKTVMKIVCRTSNRLFVGLPLCRDPDYRALNEEFTVDVIKGSQIINLFPSALKSLAAYLFTNVEPSIRRAIRHLKPIIQDRLDGIELHGSDWPEKPNDLISWLLEEAHGKQKSIRDLTLRVLFVNFTAIHTTSTAFTRVLYDLAAYPSYVQDMREEVESVINAEGLTKSALDKMRKLDSFVKESQRLSGSGALLVNRKVLKDFTFSDGTVVPAGTSVAVASFATHHDEHNYVNPNQFDGFRFAREGGEGEEGVKNQMVSPSLENVTFGIGRHACPGRFFAVNELKAMLVHLLLNYDVKLEAEGIRPADRWFGWRSIPNPTASVMFRKRA